MTAAISLRDVGRRYPFFELAGISLRLEQGEVMGLVGPNGAGKTTTIGIIMGLILADRGEVELLGHPIPAMQSRAKMEVAHVSSEMRLHGSATLAWHLGLMRSIYPSWDDGYAAALIREFNLRPAQRTGSMSLGEHARAVLLLALARKPRVLVLDEPTSGLDPVARHEVMRQLMEVIRDDGRSILLSSHNTREVEQVADRITFIDRGRIVMSDDRESCIDRWRRVIVELTGDATLPDLPGAWMMSRAGSVAVLVTDRPDDTFVALQAMPGTSIGEVQRMNLEEIFVATVMRGREGAAA